MRDDQLIRGAMGVCATVAYGGRLVFIGNGTVALFGYHVNPFAFLLVILLILAIPETLEKAPIGPTRSK